MKTMKEKGLRLYRRGFTIIELLVVIGILGVLLIALLPMVGGSRDSALTAKCKNNMKNLALGVITCAQANEHGHFPAAGMYRSVDWKSSKKKNYYPHRPWISNYGDASKLNRSMGTAEPGKVVEFSSESEEEVRMALTNGVIWQAAGSSFEIYRCPVHAREYEKEHSGRQPGWSFMMNQEFGFNLSGDGIHNFMGSSINGAIHVAIDSKGTRSKDAYRGHDKVLLLAEIQGIEVNDTKHGITLRPVTGGHGADAVLDYTQDESMGFNHKIGKKNYGGNVAFADGHVDTIMMPTEQTYIKDLTRYLCQGYPVPHDGSRYTPSEDDKK